MKKLLFLNALLIGLFMFTGSEVKAQAAAGTAGGYCGCTACNCWHGYGNCAWCVTDLAYNGAKNEMPVKITITGQKTIRLSYEIPLTTTHEENLTITSNVALPQSICAQLGVNYISLTQGSYPVDYSQNPNGDVIFNAIIQ